jgi:hypothetical protein
MRDNRYHCCPVFLKVVATPADITNPDLLRAEITLSTLGSPVSISSI